MKTTHRFILLVVLVLLGGLAGCAAGEEKKSSNLNRALALAPADASQFYFTDWSLIKGYEGYADISSKDSLDRRIKFLMFGASTQAGTPMRQSPASAYGIQYLAKHAEVWGWDTTDLVWEITLDIEGSPPLHVLQFPDDFDFGPFLARLEERGFTRSDYQGVPIYSHAQDLNTDWLRSTAAFALLNTAVLEKEKRLVFSASLDAVHNVLDASGGKAASLAGDKNVQAIAGRLGEVAAAVIAAGPDNCQKYDPLAGLGKKLTAEQQAELKEKFGVDKFHPYAALGVGYRYEGKEPAGLLIFHYAGEAAAQADLEGRRKLADEGLSLTTRRPIRETLFAVDEANVAGSDLVWQVSPANGVPRRLFDMVYRLDMPFAACP